MVVRPSVGYVNPTLFLNYKTENMRTIKFRGRRLDNNEWAYGDLIQYGKYASIRVHSVCEDNLPLYYEQIVHPETVGQFTGLTNKKGDEIYEGDELLNPQGKVGRVDFHNGSFSLIAKETKDSITRIMLTEGFCGNKSVIGNIHETK